MTFLILGCVCGCGKQENANEKSSAEKMKSTVISAEQWEKGYDLPLNEKEKEEAENDCRERMELISDIYKSVDRENAFDVVLNDETILEMQEKLAETKCPVATLVTYSNMKNYESMDFFLKGCMDGKRDSIVFYEIYTDGGIGRMKFIFDGLDMYVVSARGMWNGNDKPGICYISYTRIKGWKYTEKGWFCYELCVPEPPEVSEVMDGSCLLRITPMTEKMRELSKKCVQGLGYQGNNILCSNWDMDHMEELDFNGMFEYLYAMKYQEKLSSEDYTDGVPKEVFESLIMEYFPITAEQIEEYAAFDEEKRTYVRKRFSCNDRTFVGSCLPEVVAMKENEDGTVTLTVDAVCDVFISDDTFMTHKLTVCFAEDGSFQYLGNEIVTE